MTPLQQYEMLNQGHQQRGTGQPRNHHSQQLSASSSSSSMSLGPLQGQVVRQQHPQPPINLSNGPENGGGMQHVEGNVRQVPSLMLQAAQLSSNAANSGKKTKQQGAFMNARKACDSCTALKVKCSGERPCKRCHKKEIECFYSEAKKRGPPKRGRQESPTCALKRRKRGKGPLHHQQQPYLLGNIPPSINRKPFPMPSHFPSMASMGYGGTSFNEEITLEQIRDKFERISNEQKWTIFQTPRNLTMSLAGKVGALCEMLQWKELVQPGLPEVPEEEKAQLENEMVNVLTHLVRLADICKIDLAQAALDKLCRDQDERSDDNKDA